MHQSFVIVELYTNMCVLLPTFSASSTTILDVPNLVNPSMRDLIYVNNIEAVDEQVIDSTKPVLMAFNISGPIDSVNQITMDMVHTQRSNIDRVFERYDKPTYDRDETDGLGDTLKSDDYTVAWMTFDEFMNNHKKYLDDLKLSKRDALDFEKKCLPVLLRDTEKRPYVVLCSLLPKLLKNKKTLCFTYKPINGQIILPLMHELSDDGVYSYDVKALVRGVRLSNKPLRVLERLQRWMYQIIRHRNDYTALMTQLEGLKYYLKTALSDVANDELDGPVCHDSNGEYRTAQYLYKTTNSTIKDMAKLIRTRDDSDDSDNDDCHNMRYLKMIVRNGLSMLIAGLSEYTDERHIDIASLTSKTIDSVRLFADMKKFVAGIKDVTISPYFKKRMNYDQYEKNQKLPMPIVNRRNEYGFVKLDVCGEAQGFVYDASNRNLFVRMACNSTLNSNLYIDI